MFPDMYSRFSSLPYNLSQKVIYRRKPTNREKQRVEIPFILGGFQQNVIAKFYENKKNLHFWLILGPFIVKTRTFLENLVLFLFPGFYCCEDFQNKTTERIQKKS